MILSLLIIILVIGWIESQVGRSPLYWLLLEREYVFAWKLLVLSVTIYFIRVSYLRLKNKVKASERLGLAVIVLLTFLLTLLAVSSFIRINEWLSVVDEVNSGDYVEFVREGEGTLTLKGFIGPQSVRSLEKELKITDVIYLDSFGGLIDSAIVINQILAKHDPVIFIGDYCASACVVVIAGLDNVYASKESQFGFHSGASVFNGSAELKKFTADRSTDEMIQHFKAHNFPDKLINAVLQTPANDMTYFTGEELEEMGIVKGAF